ncbi:uncharacterized protein Z520_03231 [Fonsecaea multimorphosa CBS 102226]|uniref:Uncharacterized protein n=1 Tax=Fonsecaea multimorphosa CBS 102226 TaxID=1442371 RepID=A0A0D2K413_9EURO|nr:uncharacterized protein Z520_03231 [Fonsecaea multimorphosa CBS 102226]KIY00568.1 hypothetical protein Z520_03231 [Fonsecaea multimorphosa CBS 102226]OAL18964.1 hypothetical protein AYO22_10293 [Fonsecaea multimorphosa]
MAPNRDHKPAASAQPSRQIFVAVDFGTTFSGVAWAQTARPDVQTAILQWPDTDGSLEGQSSEKVPTQLCYVGTECLWGFGIPEEKARYQWFKLDLDPSQKQNGVSLLSVDYPDPKALPPGYNDKPSAIKVATDYLAMLHHHTEKILRLKLGDSIVDTTPLRYTITVPAIWSDAAKAKTQRCAFAAGMGHDIRMVSEPEAAVIYALDAMDPHNLQIGDNFVLCDAGGGTVDLITYTIVSRKPTVKVREAVPGAGASCGSTFLNRIFQKYLEENLSDLDGFDEDTLEDAMNEFENITKRKFTGQEESIIVRVPGLTDNVEKGIKRQKLTIKAAVLKDLFSPVMTAITTLVKSQLQQSKQAKAVILVGGFGQSPYLRSCLQQVVGENIEIMQPAYGWTAVVRGALLHALHDTTPDELRINIASRRARRAYGTLRLEWIRNDDPEHIGRPRTWNSYEGRYSLDAMRWFVEKGHEVDQRNPLVTPWYMSRPVSEGPFPVRNFTLYTFIPEEEEHAPRFPCEEVKEFVELTADLAAIHHSMIPIRKGKDGQMYYVLEYQIKIAFFSAHMEFSLWYLGTEYGKVKAEFL